MDTNWIQNHRYEAAPCTSSHHGSSTIAPDIERVQLLPRDPSDHQRITQQGAHHAVARMGERVVAIEWFAHHPDGALVVVAVDEADDTVA